MIWFIFGIMIWAVLMFLITPLLKKSAEAPGHSAEIETYKAEIARLEAEISGTDNADKAELEARKIELQRQLLALTKQTERTAAPNILIINSLFAFFVFGGVGLYAMLGSPELTKPGALQLAADNKAATPGSSSMDSGMTQQSGGGYNQAAAMNDLLGQLKARLEGDQKDDPDGWVLYARTLMNIGRFEEAFAAYETVVKLSDNHPQAVKELELARKYAADNPDLASADTAPIGSSRPGSQRGPTQADIEAAANMTPEERTAMIETMVSGLAARLEDNPGDAEGWARLLRARKYLGQTEQAKADIESIKAAFPGRDYKVEEILTQAGWEE